MVRGIKIGRKYTN